MVVVKKHMRMLFFATSHLRQAKTLMIGLDMEYTSENRILKEQKNGLNGDMGKMQPLLARLLTWETV